MKRTLITLLIVLVLLLCLGWLLYPVISDQVIRGQDAALMHSYDLKVQEMTSEQIAESFRQAEEYNDGLTAESIPDVFTKGSMNASRTYQNTLDVQDGSSGN